MEEISWSADLFAGLSVEDLALAEYATPTRVIRTSEVAPLQDLLRRSPLIRLSLPTGWRRQVPVLDAVRSTVTSPVHSQPPHIDHPHRQGDPRRYNLFLAESPRVGACTYFLPGRLGPWVAAWLAGALAGDREAWAAASPRVARYHDDPLSLSRFRVPERAVQALVALTRDGDPGPWARLSPFGQLTTLTRTLGNTPLATTLLDRLFVEVERAWPGALEIERWDEPRLIIADDTRLLHGRWGTGESGRGFFRVWLCGAEGEMLPEFEYMREEG